MKPSPETLREIAETIRVKSNALWDEQLEKLRKSHDNNCAPQYKDSNLTIAAAAWDAMMNSDEIKPLLAIGLNLDDGVKFVTIFKPEYKKAEKAMEVFKNIIFGMLAIGSLLLIIQLYPQTIMYMIAGVGLLMISWGFGMGIRFIIKNNIINDKRDKK